MVVPHGRHLGTGAYEFKDQPAIQPSKTNPCEAGMQGLFDIPVRLRSRVETKL